MASVQTSAPGTRVRRRRTFGGRSPLGWLVPAVALLVALFLPAIQNHAPNAEYWMPMTTVLQCADYVLLAVGLNIVVGYAGLLDLGYVAFFAFGAYSMAWFASSFFNGRDLHILSVAFPGPGIHISFFLVLILGAIICAIAGVIIGAPTLRLRGDYLAIVTLGFGEIIPQVARNLTQYTNGEKGITPLDPIGFGQTLHDASGGVLPVRILVFDHTPRYYIILALCAIGVIVSLQLRDGKLGRAWIAIREDELAASSMGIPLMRTKLWAYAVGAALGGFGGVFYAADISAVFSANFFFNISILILCMVIVGGMGNVWGVILGAYALQWLNITGLQVIGDQANKLVIHPVFSKNIDIPDKKFLIFGIILVLMMLFRPEGFLPAARQRALIHEEVDPSTGAAHG